MTADKQVSDAVRDHLWVDFYTIKDGKPATGWYCGCGQQLAANVVWNGRYHADHVAESLTSTLAERENAALERAAAALEDLALVLLTTSDENPKGNTLTAAVIRKGAAIVREFKDGGGAR